MIRKKSITISLPKPCNEDWNSMSISERGKFCGNCQKEVIDFTKMTDDELLKFISFSQNRFCGKFSKSQLNREIIVKSKAHSLNYKRIAASFIALLSFKFSVSQSNPKPKAETTISPISSIEKMNKENIQHKEHIIWGKIKTDRQSPLIIEKVTITIGNNEMVTYSDSLGNFKIELNSEMLKDYTIITFTHPFLTKEVRSIHKSSLPIQLDVFMEEFGGTWGVPIFDENGKISQ